MVKQALKEMKREKERREEIINEKDEEIHKLNNVSDFILHGICHMHCLKCTPGK